MPNKKVKLNDIDICNKWLINKNINPETSRKIKETGAIYKKLAKKCLDDKKIIASKLTSSNNSFKTAKSSINSNSKKIKAYKKIHKLFIPYVKRITANIIDRINYFLIIKKYLLTIKEKNNCVKLYNINEKTKQIKYRIGRNIILDKRIGTDGIYGIVFLSHFKSKLDNKFDKLNKFAVKITNDDIDNKKEINILKKLTNYTIQLYCPHFPISYGFFKCNTTDNSSNNTDNKDLFPKIINSNKSLLIQINELASGDLEFYLMSIKNKDFSNTLPQLLLSIMFFHNYIKSYHNDCHLGNFLYHKIKPGGYFHYNIYGTDYYLENKGYLWVIWDFSFTEPYNTNTQSINTDFTRILNALDYFRKYFTNKEFVIYYKLYHLLKDNYNINDYNYLYNINKVILDYLITNIKSFTTIKPSNIINKIPFIITTPKNRFKELPK
jgi:hypothetical protein